MFKVKFYVSTLNIIFRAVEDGGKRTVFIANTIALVHQQCTFLSRHTLLKCKGYTGDMNVDNWLDERWHEEINSNQVLMIKICCDLTCDY